MLFVLIAVAISYYLVGFGRSDEYEVTDRTVQELRLYPQGRKSLTTWSKHWRRAEGREVPRQEGKFIARPAPSALAHGPVDDPRDDHHRHRRPGAHRPVLKVLYVLLFSIVGMAGSYCVAWYGIRVNTYANCRTAFASLRGKPWDVVNIPLRAGMSVGLFLISLELVMMVDHPAVRGPRQIVGVCFLGFAIGESLGASALRIAGGIFTKIADIGSDLMKIVFNVKEDDPRNPGVIADCTGDNAGDSVGPTADGFETYGVTGVALIAFITLAVHEHRHPGQADRLDLRHALPDGLHVRRVVLHQPGDLGEEVRGLNEFDFEQPLTRLIWIAAILCISRRSS